MILALNTAEPMHELVFVHENPAVPGERELLSEKQWPDDRNDVENLVPFIASELEKLGAQKKEITEIFVVNGPGSFTSLRTGIACAQGLAEGLAAPLYAMNTFELLRRKATLSGPLLVVLHAGGLDVGVQYFSEGVQTQQRSLDEEGIRIGALSDLLKNYPHDHGIHIMGRLPETAADELHALAIEKKWKMLAEHELQSLGEMLLTFGLKGLKPVTTLETVYLKPPHITPSSNPWKQ